MMRSMRLLCLPLLLAMAACGSTQVALPYSPAAGAAPQNLARPVVALSPQVANQRQTGREDPTWLGTIRGGYGNPINSLQLPEPVDRVVGKAFESALAARGLASAAGAQPRYSLAVTIHQFDANQYVRREATADFSVVLIETATGREVWRDREKAYIVDGSVFAVDVGIFASPENLRRVAAQAMNQAIDRLVEKPGFMAAIRG